MDSLRTGQVVSDIFTEVYTFRNGVGLILDLSHFHITLPNW